MGNYFKNHLNSNSFIFFNMKLIGHRGYKTEFIRENTFEAFTNALNNGFIGIECDVRETKDKKLVICHDAFIDRVSDGNGLLKNYTYEELTHFNFGSDDIPSKIPLLNDVLKLQGIKIVELKERISLDTVLDIIDDDTYFISFDTGYILGLKKKYPKLKFGILNYGLNSIKDYDLDMICILDMVATDRLVSSFTKKGVKVFVYGITGDINYKSEDENIFYIADKKY